MLQHLAESSDSEYDGIIIDNLPNDGTRQDGPETTAKVSMSETVLVGLAGVAKCEIIGYRQEKRGALIDRVEPEPGKEHTQSNAGTVKFNFHSDNAFLSRRATSVIGPARLGQRWRHRNAPANPGAGHYPEYTSETTTNSPPANFQIFRAREF